MHIPCGVHGCVYHTLHGGGVLGWSFSPGGSGGQRERLFVCHRAWWVVRRLDASMHRGPTVHCTDYTYCICATCRGFSSPTCADSVWIAEDARTLVCVVTDATAHQARTLHAHRVREPARRTRHADLNTCSNEKATQGARSKTLPKTHKQTTRTTIVGRLAVEAPCI